MQLTHIPHFLYLYECALLTMLTLTYIICHLLFVQHDGLLKKHGWYLEKINVTDMKTGQEWIFYCKNWLSLHEPDYRIKRDLIAEEKQVALEGRADIHYSFISSELSN